jgi:hypothetical protein
MEAESAALEANGAEGARGATAPGGADAPLDANASPDVTSEPRESMVRIVTHAACHSGTGELKRTPF